ncbi:fibronectin type III domain-containing protein [Patescibacteria group bacterium]
MNAVKAATNTSKSPGTYLFTISSLTPKEVAAQETIESMPEEVSVYPEFSSFAVFAPFFLFFGIFIGAFGMLFMSRTRNFKNVFTSAVIALFAATIPTLMTVMNDQNSLYVTKAGPDETPRNVRVVHQSPTSALVLWETDAKHIGAVKLSPVPFNDDTTSIINGDFGKTVTHHTVTLDNLKHGTAYDFVILSGSQWFDNGGAPLQFRTE